MLCVCVPVSVLAWYCANVNLFNILQCTRLVCLQRKSEICFGEPSLKIVSMEISQFMHSSSVNLAEKPKSFHDLFVNVTGTTICIITYFFLMTSISGKIILFLLLMSEDFFFCTHLVSIRSTPLTGS